MKFNPRPVEDGLFTADQLIRDGGWGGSANFAYDHSKFWPALIQLCAGRRAEQMERWRALGAKVGVSEWDIKTGPVQKPEPVLVAPEADPPEKTVEETGEIVVEDREDAQVAATA